MPQPKAHKYKQSQRLSKAKTWMKTYTGKKLYQGYAKHFGVSKLCAIIELEMLGIEISPELKENIKRSEEDKKIRKEKLKLKKEESLVESDYYFAYIVGYTSGGAPYGITWEEMEEIENNESSCNQDISTEDDELPF